MYHANETLTTLHLLIPDWIYKTTLVPMNHCTVLYIYTKPPECVDIIRLSGHQQGKLSDVRQIISTHEGSFVFIIHPT